MNQISDHELVELFNESVGIRAFGIARQKHLNCIHSEFIKRDIDYSIVGGREILSFASRVKLIGKALKKL